MRHLWVPLSSLVERKHNGHVLLGKTVAHAEGVAALFWCFYMSPRKENSPHGKPTSWCPSSCPSLSPQVLGEGAVPPVCVQLLLQDNSPLWVLHHLFKKNLAFFGLNFQQIIRCWPQGRAHQDGGSSWDGRGWWFHRGCGPVLGRGTHVGGGLISPMTSTPFTYLWGWS